MTSLLGGIRRFLRYNLVGVMGLGVKFAVLAASIEFAGLGYLIATLLAVEATVMHNFLWHLRWTWVDRCAGLSVSGTLRRLVKFHLGTGSVALFANLLVMKLLTGELGIHYVPANLVATAFAGVANYVISNWLVFAAGNRPASCRT